MADTDDTESAPMPLDGRTSLTEAERLQLRRMLREYDRMTWLRRQLRFLIWPAIVSVVGALWVAGDWILRHVRVTP